MAQLTRRVFIGKTSAGAAALGALAATPGLVGSAHASSRPHAAALAAKLDGPLMAHVRNIATGEIALMVGTREVIIRDHELVARLVKAAQ